jgi:hypothetical protein
MCSKQIASCGELRQVFKTEHHHRTRFAFFTELSSRPPRRIQQYKTAIQRRPQRSPPPPRWSRLFVRIETNPGPHDPANDPVKHALPKLYSLVNKIPASFFPFPALASLSRFPNFIFSEISGRLCPLRKVEGPLFDRNQSSMASHLGSGPCAARGERHHDGAMTSFSTTA